MVVSADSRLPFGRLRTSRVAIRPRSGHASLLAMTERVSQQPARAGRGLCRGASPRHPGARGRAPGRCTSGGWRRPARTAAPGRGRGGLAASPACRRQTRSTSRGCRARRGRRGRAGRRARGRRAPLERPDGAVIARRSPRRPTRQSRVGRRPGPLPRSPRPDRVGARDDGWRSQAKRRRSPPTRDAWIRRRGGRGQNLT